MIGTLLGIIFVLIVVGVLWWAVQRVLALIPLAEPFKTLVDVLIVLVAVVVALWVVAQLLGMVGIHVGFPQGFH